jgi:transcriptional regulator with XRE-family HTH domain
MLASKPNPEAGERLRRERLRVRLSTRDVERLSQIIAQEKKNQEYYFSHGWLTDVENGAFTPSIYKLYSLSLIYKRHYDEILGFFGINIGDLGREQAWTPLPGTHLIREPSSQVSLPEELRRKIESEKTNLVSHMFQRWGELPVGLLAQMDPKDRLCGYVGMDDFTLYPVIRPGSFVEIDPRQRKIDSVEWVTFFDRPIYFVELRDSYACCWCEVKDRHLFLVPFPQAGITVRQVRYPADADIVGRVTAVSMRIAGAENNSSKLKPLPTSL